MKQICFIIPNLEDQVKWFKSSADKFKNKSYYYKQCSKIQESDLLGEDILLWLIG